MPGSSKNNKRARGDGYGSESTTSGDSNTSNGNAKTTKSSSKKRRKGSDKPQIPAFLTKTYDIMDDPKWDHIASWSNGGNCVMIKEVAEFCQKVLPVFFKHNNFTSFVRQLNMYGFHKTKQDPNWREFQHPMFKKGQRHLLTHIKRNRRSNNNNNNSNFGFKTEQGTDLATMLTEFQTVKQRLAVAERNLSEMSVINQNLMRQNDMMAMQVQGYGTQINAVQQGFRQVWNVIYDMYDIFRQMHNNSSTLPSSKASEVERKITACQKQVEEHVMHSTASFELTRQALSIGNSAAAKYSFPRLPSLPAQQAPTVRDSMSFQYPSFGSMGRSLNGVPRSDSLEVLQNYLGNAQSILQLPGQVTAQLPKQNSMGTHVPTGPVDPGALAAAAHAKAFAATRFPIPFLNEKTTAQ